MGLLRHVKAVVKTIVSPLGDATGLYQRRILEGARKPGCWTVVMYHRIIDDAALDPFTLGMCVRREHFERQASYLQQTFNVITLADGAARLARGEALPERALSITFDDGYLDNLTLALPVLRTRGLPFTVFVPCSGMESDEPLWWDRAIAAMACATRPQVDLQALGLAAAPKVLALTGVRRMNSVQRILEALWQLPIDEAHAAVARLERLLEPKDMQKMAAHRLSPRQVRELRAAGVEIGAHSMRHPNLALMSDDDALREILDSRAALEDLLQEPVTGFAYPGGHMRDVTARLARQAGFAYAAASVSGINQPGSDLFALRRIGMPDAPLADFRRAFSNKFTGRASATVDEVRARS